jgi:hypothetical protein
MSTEGHHRVRASDPEREAFVTILRAAMSEGRLTLQEGEERIARVYAATYRDELPPTTDDLPDGGRRAVQDTPEAQDDAKRGARRFVAGRLTIALMTVGTVLTIGALSHGHFPWFIIPLAFLAFALRRRARFHHWASGFGGPGPWGGAHGPSPRGAWGHRPWGHGPWGYGNWGHGNWGEGPSGPGPGGRTGTGTGRPDDGEGWGR